MSSSVSQLYSFIANILDNTSLLRWVLAKTQPVNTTVLLLGQNENRGR